jgi:hypothetical protein
MIEELESEVAEMRAVAVRVGAGQLKTLEDESKKLNAELDSLKKQSEETTSKVKVFPLIEHSITQNLLF